MRFAEALIGDFGKETTEELLTWELMDMLSKEINKSADTVSRDATAAMGNSSGEDVKGKRNASEALEDARTNNEAGKRQHLPATCSICFGKIALPMSIAACKICEDDANLYGLSHELQWMRF
jgi:hypothetical protein